MSTRRSSRRSAPRTRQNSSAQTFRSLLLSRLGFLSKLYEVPERFMKPRLVLILSTLALFACGVVMIYSASSITALIELGNSSYYLQKQLMFGLVGIGLAALIGAVSYHRYLSGSLWFLMTGGIIFLLLIVLTPFAGKDVYGATRWISIGPLTLQPSEFAKGVLVVVGASLVRTYLEDPHDMKTLTIKGSVYLLIPLVLILLQPDKGTTMIIGATLLIMAFIAGFDRRILWGAVLFVALLGIFFAVKDDYSRQRIMTMFNPWLDRFGSGYQLIQGFCAFASGGLGGVGLGFSRQKYSYLPMAHNDFIFAVIGEEAGLIGIVVVLVLFLALLWAGYKIAQHAPDLEGRLIASGAASLLLIQLFLNIFGVLGWFPLSGKPIPFLSYGGSSILGTFFLIGLILSVSLHSYLPETSHEGARRSFSFAEGGSQRSISRSASRASQTFASSQTSFASKSLSSGSTHARTSSYARARERIDLGPSAADRLRTSRSRRSRS